MCLIIRSDKGFNELDDELLSAIYNRNSHGFGYMYYDEQQGLVVDKNVYTLAETKRIIRSLPDDRPVYVHWRMATSGKIDKERCHPYKVNNGLAMMHNGVLSQFEPSGSKRSKKINNTTDSKGKQTPSSTKKKDKVTGSNKRGSGRHNFGTGHSAGTAAKGGSQRGPTPATSPTNLVWDETTKRYVNVGATSGSSKGANANVKTTNPGTSDVSVNSSNNKGTGSTKKTAKNDTLNFIEKYVRPSLKIDPYIYLDGHFIKQTENTIGINNKLVFMDDEGQDVIYNEDEWVEMYGMLFSNKYAWPYYQRKYPATSQGQAYKGKEETFVPADANDPSYRVEVCGGEDLAGGVYRDERERLADPFYSGGQAIDFPSEYNPLAVVTGIEDLQGLSWQSIYELVHNEPDVIADILSKDVIPDIWAAAILSESTDYSSNNDEEEE